MRAALSLRGGRGREKCRHRANDHAAPGTAVRSNREIGEMNHATH
jgi:hypothetical protein